MTASRLSNWIRPHLRSFIPYSSARSEVTGGRIFLDANELSSGSGSVLSGIDGAQLNRYPDPESRELRRALGKRYGLDPASVFMGSGSDEIIDLLIRLFCEPGRDTIAVFEPTYGVYRVAASLSGVGIEAVELDAGFGIRADALLGSVSPRARIAFLCSPNNPTANLLDAREVLRFAAAFPGLVVVDQAYVEFSSDPLALVAEAGKRDNLVLLRTFSKAWGLAGIRLGYCLADPELVSYLLRIKPPYNIGTLTAKLGLEALEEDSRSGRLDQEVEKVKKNRSELGAKLESLNCVRRVFPSEANFILAEFTDRDQAYRRLLDRGIVVRRRSESRLKTTLRITVGTEAENAELARTLAELEGERP